METTEKAKAALGAESEVVGTCMSIDPATLNPEDRIKILEEQMRHMHRVLTMLRKAQGEKQTTPAKQVPEGELNKDGIPIGTLCLGSTERSPFLFYLTVEPDGYLVGHQLFQSLSAAAEAVSRVRRSGWTFWKLTDGRTLKEVFRG